MTITVDLFYAKADRLLYTSGVVQLPSQWVLTFSAPTDILPYMRSYGFAVKPTRKQIKEKRKIFEGLFDMFLRYN